MVVVLASGRGERFIASGGQGSKLQAEIGGRTVLDRTLDAVRRSGLPWHVEDAGHPGMGDSIAAGVEATRDAAGWLILPGDLPLVHPQSLRIVAEALKASAVVLPTHRGVRGHPVGFARECGEALRALNGPLGAAPVVKAWAARGATTTIEIDDPGIVTDIDTLADLQAVRTKLSAGSS